MFDSQIYRAGLRAACAGAAQSGALNGKKILITGATGLIGSYLADALLLMNDEADADIQIYAAGRSVQGMRSRFSERMDRDCFHYVPYDARNAVSLNFEADHVIHAATSAHPLAYATDPVGTMQANLIGTMQLLQTLNTQGHGRLVMLSTGEIYGENAQALQGFRETDHGWIDSMAPRSCYPESKRAAETLCASYTAQYGTEAIVARLCHVYGPTFTRTNSRADAQFIRKALAGEDIVMKSEGSQVRSYCYVADAAAALLTLMCRGKSGQAYNVANRFSTVSIRQFAETLAQIAGVRLTFDLPEDTERAGYSKITRAVLDPTKLERLGWEPHYDLRRGLEETLQCAREGGAAT